MSEQISATATAAKQVYLTRRSPQYWRVTIDHPPLNIFGPDTIPQLDEIITAIETDEQLLAYARERGGTVYHPTSTCKMGVDAMAVVDPELRVHGLGGLRVADASIMPTVVSGNTNAATIMIGERAADMVRQEMKLAA